MLNNKPIKKNKDISTPKIIAINSATPNGISENCMILKSIV
jgi:hypothetical protein